jgi:hypothetical protein
VYTTEQALTQRLMLASVTPSAMAEAVGQRVAAEEASARLRSARDAAELRSALSAARHLHVPAVVTELAEMRLQEMQADALPRHVVAQMSDHDSDRLASIFANNNARHKVAAASILANCSSEKPPPCSGRGRRVRIFADLVRA